MDPVFLTPEGLKKLEQELEQLKGPERKEIADRIRVALQQGDLSENAEYQEAKEAQALNEQRIVEMEEKVKQAKVIRKSTGTNVRLGSTVEIESDEFGAQTYSIVGAHEANPSEGRISNESPIGAALIGHEKGDKVMVQTPGGEMEYKIKTIS
ncbi:MAG: transcription elongation factor GreA [Candidatus Doudnabacteria bacterium]|nr:transcription elongation factor GreA [Candidatus Doudnabacteria bacterium]MCA9387631.1 transcription elongation factor GreA [Candidatus Andersenbacteria bacterium]